MDDLLSEFLTETAESLDVVDVELVKFESDPNNTEVLDKVFRLVHTVKGTCGFLGLPRLESVAHAAETMLGKFRDGELTVTPHAVTLILESLDHIKVLLAHLESEEREPEGDDSELIGRLEEAARGEIGSSAPATVGSEQDESFDSKLGRPLTPGEVPLEELEKVFNETSVGDDTPEPQNAPPAPQAVVNQPENPQPAKAEGGAGDGGVRPGWARGSPYNPDGPRPVERSRGYGWPRGRP